MTTRNDPRVELYIDRHTISPVAIDMTGDITTTGDITGGNLKTGTMTITGGSITDSTNAIDFGNEALTTTGAINGAGITGTALVKGATGYFGGAIHYSNFEADGTMKMNGNATVWNDIQFSLATAKVPASNAPTWSAFTGNLKKYTFAINDYVDLEAQELPHGYKEGSDIDFHIHIYTNGEEVGDHTVKYSIEYAIVNVDGVASATTVSLQFTIPAATTTLTHLFLDLADVTGTDFNFGDDISLQLKRIATDTGTDPAADPFVSMFGIHYESDTIGSRQESIK